MFNSVMQQLQPMLPADTDICAAYNAGDEEDCIFILRLCMFLTTFFKGHIRLLEVRVEVMCYYSIILYPLYTLHTPFIHIHCRVNMYIHHIYT